MSQPYNRISETVLFSALLAVAIGWMAVSTAAADHRVAHAPVAPVVASAGANHS